MPLTYSSHTIEYAWFTFYYIHYRLNMSVRIIFRSNDVCGKSIVTKDVCEATWMSSIPLFIAMAPQTHISKQLLLKRIKCHYEPHVLFFLFITAQLYIHFKIAKMKDKSNLFDDT